jgi:hypothetical protein
MGANTRRRGASGQPGQYRRQLALDPDWPLLPHGPQLNVSYILATDQITKPAGFGGMPIQANVGYWHQPGQPIQSNHVRCWGQTGNLFLGASGPLLTQMRHPA